MSVFKAKKAFKAAFSIFISGSQFVQLSKTVCAMMVDDIWRLFRCKNYIAFQKVVKENMSFKK